MRHLKQHLLICHHIRQTVGAKQQTVVPMQLLQIDIALDRRLGSDGSCNYVFPGVVFCLLLRQLAALDHELHNRVVRRQKLHAFGGKQICPAPVSEELQKQILGEGGKPVDCRIEDAKRTGEDFQKAKEALGDLARSEEDVMSYICYPDQTMKFLTDRKAKEENICKYSIVEA